MRQHKGQGGAVVAASGAPRRQEQQGDRKARTATDEKGEQSKHHMKQHEGQEGNRAQWTQKIAAQRTAAGPSDPMLVPVHRGARPAAQGAVVQEDGSPASKLRQLVPR